MRSIALFAVVLVAATVPGLSGCSKGGETTGTAASSATTAADAAPTPAGMAVATGAASAPSQTTFAGRTGELTHPEDGAVVLLYHDLSGVPAPISQWVEKDASVQFAQPVEKQPHREQLTASLNAAAASVRNVGLLRLTTNASLSPYDPGYGEFTVGALAPSAIYNFSAFGETVSLKFGNAQQAQTWKVPVAGSQAVLDKIGYLGSVQIDMLVRVTQVQPGPAGGSITADVVSYELRDQTGTALARVAVAG